MSALAGGVCFGLVWGWLLGAYRASSHPSGYGILVVATSVATGETAALADNLAAATFVVAAGGALAVRLLWQGRLIRHAPRLPTGDGR